ncbi:MAG TPA: hypothetical protein VG797_04590, partial [Phycisphaerales bacterium]|nr:hypothetical protein [Phycisphaerales bacterium]
MVMRVRRSACARSWVVAALIVAGLGVVSARAAPPGPPAPVTRDLTSRRDWSVHVEIVLRSPNVRNADQFANPQFSYFAFSQSKFYFPLISGAAAHDMDVAKASGWLRRGT